MIIDVNDLNKKANSDNLLEPSASSNNEVTLDTFQAEISNWLKSTSKRNKALFKTIKAARRSFKDNYVTFFKIFKYIDLHQDDTDTTLERKLSEITDKELNRFLGIETEADLLRLLSSNDSVEIISLNDGLGLTLKESAIDCGLLEGSNLWKFLFENKSAEINRWLAGISGFKKKIQPDGKSAVLFLNENIELLNVPLKRFEVIEEALGGTSLFTDYPFITWMLAVDEAQYKFKQVYEVVNSKGDDLGWKPLITEEDLIEKNRGLMHKLGINDPKKLLAEIKSGNIESVPEIETKISLLINDDEKIRESSKDEVIIKLAALADEFQKQYPMPFKLPTGAVATELNKVENQEKIIKKIKKAILDDRNAEKAFMRLNSLVARAGKDEEKPSEKKGEDPENPPETPGSIFGTILEKAENLFSDGTQTLANPFGDPEGKILRFSFRPVDMKNGYAMIQICPASFQEVANLAYVLDTMPYIVVQEFYMKNTASDVIDLLKENLSGADGEADPSNKKMNETSTKAKEKIKGIIDSFLSGLNGDVRGQVISLPWKLYHKMKAELPGNEYHLPYIAEDQYIAKSSNDSQWQKNEGLLAGAVKAAGSFINGMLAKTMGVALADIFPAPTWSGSADESDKFTITMNLTLINDDYDKARYNYMFANSIIHNNRVIQKTILTFPGALYKIVLPTGTRCMMCTGNFELKPIGINRIVPAGFFLNPTPIGARGEIGEPNHNDAYEVIPDAYSLTLTFTSCISANLNETIFGYYLDVARIGVPQGKYQEQVGTLSVPISFGDYLKNNGKKTMTLDEEILIGQVESDLAKTYDVLTLVSARLVRGAFENLMNKSPAEQDEIIKSYKVKFNKDDDLKTKSLVEKYSKEYSHLILRRKEFEDQLIEIQSNLDFLNKQKDELTAQKEKSNISDRSAIIKNLNKVDIKLAQEKKQYEKKLDLLFDVETNLIHLSKLDIEKMLRLRKFKLSTKDFSYYEQPELDEVEKAKWMLMTTAEREVYLMQLRIEIEKHDPNGIFKTKDWKLRAFAIGEIYNPALKELSDLIHKYLDDSDIERYEKALRKYKLIKSDLDLAFDTSKDFKPCLIYIAEEDKTAASNENSEFEGWGDYIFSDESSESEALDNINDKELDVDLNDDILESENARRSQELIELKWQSEEKFLAELKEQFNKFTVRDYNLTLGETVKKLLEKYEDDLSEILEHCMKLTADGEEYFDDRMLIWKDISNIIIKLNFKLINEGYNDEDLNKDLNDLIENYNIGLNAARENATSNYLSTLQKDAFEMFEKFTHGYYSEKNSEGKYSVYQK